MTLEEKLAYIGGEREFFIRAVPRLGIPEIKFADGPVGCRNWGPSTAYPATVGLAATFDTSLAKRVGQAMARDSRARGVHVLLAPGVNLQRSPLNGRNFEYLGEDPILAGTLATELVRGIQSEGVLATVKHFAANNQEWDRNHVSSEVTERTLRELYLLPFERVVKEARVGAVMSAYNLLNGIYASHHPWLLKTVLKQEWGFRGFVMSDWVAVHDPVGGALGGCDLEMPRAQEMSPRNLRSLLDAGTLPMAELDDKVRRILRALIDAKFLDREQVRKDVPLDDPASRKIALEAATKSLVLLKNEGAVLPFDPKKMKRIALVGPNVHPLVHGASGSAYVTPLHAVSIKDAIAAEAPNVQISYHPGIQERTTFSAMGAPVFAGPVKEELFKGKALEGNPVAVREIDRIDFDPDDGVAPAPGLGHELYSIRWTGNVDLPKNGKYDIMTNADDGIRVFVDGKNLLDDWSDHAPRTTLKTVNLTRGRHQVTVEYFQGTLGAIAQFGLGPSIEGNNRIGEDTLDRALENVDAVVLCLGFGQSAGSNSLSRQFNAFWPPGFARSAGIVESEDSDRPFALPAVQLDTLRRVTDKHKRTVVVLNAGGGVALDWLDRVQGLLWAWYPGQEGGTALVRTLFGAHSPSGKLPITLARRYADHPSAPFYQLNEGGKTPYGEELLMGYRGFDAAGTEPLFPFGFGLSYTTFAYDGQELVRDADGAVTVSFTVKNTGTRPGDEVAQVYVVPPAGKQRPPQKLEGYARVSLSPGATERVSVKLAPRAFAYWDSGWRVEPGRYTIAIGSSSRDRRATVAVEMAAADLGR
jgi:beta-glucosidase